MKILTYDSDESIDSSFEDMDDEDWETEKGSQRSDEDENAMKKDNMED